MDLTTSQSLGAELKGVTPDVATSADQALNVAMALALGRLMETEHDPAKIDAIRSSIAKLANSH